MLSQLWRRLKLFLSNSPGSYSYVIFKPCYRCVYSKKFEPVLIYSRDRGPRVIVNFKGSTYVRQGECIGFKQCGKCFEQIIKIDPSLPCKWRRI